MVHELIMDVISVDDLEMVLVDLEGVPYMT